MSNTTTTTTESTATDIFPSVDLKGSLLNHFENESLIQDLIKFVKLIPNYGKLKLDIELTSLIINIIEDKLKGKSTDDKTNILVQVLTQIFNLNPNEITIIQQQITFLQNNNFIKGIPITKKIFKYITKWIFRKIG